MFGTSAFHDTYYVVAHVEWLALITALSLVVVVLSLGIRRWSASTLARKLRRYMVVRWTTGLLLTLGHTVTWQFIEVQRLMANPSLPGVLNDVASVAGFLMLLAIILALAMIFTELWHRLYRFRR